MWIVKNLIVSLCNLLVLILFTNQCCHATSSLKLMLKLDLSFVMVHLKLSYEEFTKSLMDELEGKFPNHEQMFMLGVWKFWGKNLDDIWDDFHWCLIVIKVAYCSPCKVAKDEAWMETFLDNHYLDLQCSFFKMTMNAKRYTILKEVFDVNHVVIG